MKGFWLKADERFDARALFGRPIAYPMANADRGPLQAVDSITMAIDDSAGVGVRFPGSTSGSRGSLALYPGRKTVNSTMIDYDEDGNQKHMKGQRDPRRDERCDRPRADGVEGHVRVTLPANGT